MASQPIKTIFVIGGTGAQGLPVIQALSPLYSLRVLTRDVTSPRAQSLLAIPNVTLQEGTFANEEVLRKGFSEVEGAFVNIDGFNTGEKNELYWAIRTYEIALQSGVKFFVYGNLEYISKESGYDPRFRAGHYDGKGRVGEWILFQNQTNRQKMASALFTTGPYMEMTISSKTLMSPTTEDGVVTWTAPMGKGKWAPIALDDVGVYVKWLFEHRERADGMDLKVAIDSFGFAELASAFEKVTGRKARFVDVGMEEFWNRPGMRAWGEREAGYNAGKGSMSVKDNFTGGWNIWRYGVEEGIIRRDYNLLDEIHPLRIKGVEEWFARENQKGIEEGKGGLWERVQNQVPILKIGEDGWTGKL